jgi:hypothetical protein
VDRWTENKKEIVSFVKTFMPFVVKKSNHKVHKGRQKERKGGKQISDNINEKLSR